MAPPLRTPSPPASVPVSLDVLMRSGRVRPGHRVLLAAVGSGIGYGAVVWLVGA